MFGILVVAHGRLAEALVDTAAMIVAKTSHVAAVPFLPGEGPEDLEAAIIAALDMLPPGPVLALADLPGGTPASVLSTLALQGKPLAIATGVNVPMLVETILAQGMDSAPAAGWNEPALAELAMTAGSAGLVNVTAALQPGRATRSEGGGA